MASDNDKDKKGFSGLSDLASEVNSIGESTSPDLEAEAKNSTPQQAHHPQRKTSSDEPDRKATSSPPPIENVNTGKNSSDSTGKWILGTVGIVFAICILSAAIQSSRMPSHKLPYPSQSHNYPQSSPAPAAQPTSTPQSSPLQSLQYTEPPVGTNNVLSVPEIRWCLREKIRIDTMRDWISTNQSIVEFNRIVNDYNRRCASYRYRQGSHQKAEDDVQTHRTQIVTEAMRDAGRLGRSHQPSHSLVFPDTSQAVLPKTPNIQSSPPKTPSAQYTREAQQLLLDLGYDPGPVDGKYGPRTAGAVKDFQRDVGITQDGWIDEDLLSTLRRAKAAYKPPVVSQPKPQTQTSLQPRSSTPSAATVARPENLSFEEQSKYDAAQRLRRLGYNVHWRTSSLTAMLDAESRISAANRLARLGYNVDWRNYSLTAMLDAESRISAANRLKRKGISVDWQNYSLTQLLNMEYGRN